MTAAAGDGRDARAGRGDDWADPLADPRGPAPVPPVRGGVDPGGGAGDRAGRVWAWLVRLACWDGLLPAAVWGVPVALRWALPGVPGVLELTAVGLPIVAFFARLAVGRSHIAGNRCGPWVRRGQTAALVTGLLAVVLADVLVILLAFLPRPARGDRVLLVLGGLYLFYLVCVGFALFPGFGPPTEPRPRRRAAIRA